MFWGLHEAQGPKNLETGTRMSRLLPPESFGTTFHNSSSRNRAATTPLPPLARSPLPAVAQHHAMTRHKPGRQIKTGNQDTS